MRPFAPLALAALALAGCSARPPASWVHGGAAIDLPRAHWDRGDRSVDVMPDGHVLVGGDHAFSLDRAGRVSDTDGDPIALLEPDGRLMGEDDRQLGVVGPFTASLPRGHTAWVALGPRGEVTHFDLDGEPGADGAWAGCGPFPRTCTLVTHLVSLFELRRRSQMMGSGVGVGGGFGIGIGIGIGFGRGWR